MAMACRAGAAQAGRPPMPVAASSVPSAPRSSVRRDACTCVTCGEAKMGARGARMRFVRFCGNLPQPAGAGGSRIFGTFVALLQAQYRLSGSLEGSRSRRISHGESRPKRRSFGWAQGRERVEQRIIGMDHRIARARPLGRALTAAMAAAGLLTGGLAGGAGRAGPDAALTAPAQKPAAPKQAPAAQPAPPQPQQPPQQGAADQPR